MHKIRKDEKIPYSVFRIPYSVFRIPYSVFRIPYSVFRIPYSVFRVTTASAIGNQQNTNLAANNIAVEGFRAQFPDFLDALTNLIPPGVQTGGAVNVQVVNNPLGTTDAIASVSTIAGNKEYAEITW